jgi:hypothetical protein
MDTVTEAVSVCIAVGMVILGFVLIAGATGMALYWLWLARPGTAVFASFALGCALLYFAGFLFFGSGDNQGDKKAQAEAERRSADTSART